MALTTNGNQKDNMPAMENLPEHRQKIVEYGILATQQTAQERDAALFQVDDLTKQLAALRVEIASLQALSGAMESRMESFQHSRDEAVARRAEYEVILRSIQAQLREFGIEHEPIVSDNTERG
jgi:chromosome segregation ATPase